MMEVWTVNVGVLGGTGMTGARVVAYLERAGHQVRVLARSAGVDARSGAGLADAVRGLDAVIDASNAHSQDEREASDAFVAIAANLQRAASDAHVARIVSLSIVGIDRVPYGYYLAKLRQEAHLLAGRVPVLIVRATQFHEFAAQSLGWGRNGDRARIPSFPTQPVALDDVVTLLADAAVAPSFDAGLREVAGPQREALPDLVRRLAVARGKAVTIEPWSNPPPIGPLLAAGALLPAPHVARVGPTFETWLATPR